MMRAITIGHAYRTEADIQSLGDAGRTETDIRTAVGVKILRAARDKELLDVLRLERCKAAE